MIVYNLFPLLTGRCMDWEKHFERASKMGFNWIFMNPIQRPGRSGSLYSIADYFDFNPDFLDDRSSIAPRDQVRNTVKKAEEMGLAVMIDLVINHCAADSELLKLHPDWFVWATSGQIVHPFAYENGKKVVWNDLAMFDLRNTKDLEGIYRYVVTVVDFLIDIGFKGFRCDAAYLLPNPFWERLIGETKGRHPEVRFFAETLGCTPEQTKTTALAGFDYIFNSSKWWDFHSPWLMEQYNLMRSIVPSISFPESHDTKRLCDELGGNIDGLTQRYLFAALFSAGVMMPIGFEFGFRKRLNVVRTRPEDWEESEIDLREFITRVNRLKANYKLLQQECPTEILGQGNSNILLLRKASTSSQEELLLILNKDIAHTQHFHEENLYRLFQAKGRPVVDVSPEHSLDDIPTPFSYDLHPGQGIVLFASNMQVPGG